MPIQPMDLQNLFMRMHEVSREQSVLKEGAHLQQTLQGSEIAKKAELKDHSVTETEDLGDGIEKTKDGEEKKEQRKNEEEKREQEDKSGKKKKSYFDDPDLGHHIDITG
ncbi:MAG: hypothetical protein ACLFR1_00590 [Spirochaetia bacterium]